MTIIKRSGEEQELDVGKILSSIEWSSDGLNINTEEVVKAANIQISDGMRTSQIHDILIKVTDDMSSLRYIDYDKMSARLLMQKVYHEAFGSIRPKSLQSMIANDSYRDFSEYYSDKEIDELSVKIKYDRNFIFSKAGLSTLIDKYMIKSNGSVIEDPQTMFMAISMDIFKNIKKDRLKLISDFYDALSTFKISLPTPMMKTLRTSGTDYASCIKINIGDNTESLSLGMDAIMKHTMASAGVGIDSSMVSSIGDKIKNGTISHAGKIPLYKVHDSIIQSSSQNGRRGSANEHTFATDPEILTVLALKSPKTETAKRIQDMKHAIKFNQVIYDMISNDETMYLFSPRVEKEMYDNFHDNDKFKEIYDIAVANKTYSGSVPAREFAEAFIDARVETGVYYVFNADETNSNSPYKQKITQSNICLEHLAPSAPLSEDTSSPDITVCILSGVNQAKVGKSELEDIMKLLVWGLNEIIHLQKHPTPQANSFVRNYAALGIGLNSHAHWLAEQGFKYGDIKALAETYHYSEAMQYYGLKASMEYARDFDKCIPLFHKTKYSNGIMPQDRAKTLDGTPEPVMDWDKLRDDIRANGLANATITMNAPGETSSMIGNQTSSLEPIRKPMTIKDSKTGSIKQYAPNCIKLADKYDYAFDTKHMTIRLMQHAAVIQQWIDQSSSLNTFYNKELYDNGKIPMEVIWGDIKAAKELGIKTIYYNNTYIEDVEQDEREECVGCSM